MDVCRESSRGPHMRLERPKLSSGGAYVQDRRLKVSGTAVSRPLCLCAWLSAQSTAEQGQ